MKNKKIPNWLHRLPVLFLALILAVLPLTMAAPAHADVLTGAKYSFVQIDNAVCYIPGVHNSVAFCIKMVDGVLIAQAFYSEDVIHFGNNGYGFVVYCDSFADLYYASMIVSPETTVVDFRDVFFESRPYAQSVDGYLRIVGGPDTVGFPEVVSVSEGSSSGVLDTFSGVGFWLSGAVQNISTMFWAAESGMTVLGYLAVASLALAVILLIFYLIAGWLKFH